MTQLTTDLISALSLLGVTAVIALAYLLRVWTRGSAHFDRVNRQGSSVYLGKSLMEMGYWGLQPVARLLVFFHVTPNQLSWVSLGLGLGAGVCLANGHFGSAAVCATASALLDTLDGMVARMQGVASNAGEVLDAAVDRYAEFFFLSGLILHYGEHFWIQVVALVALAGSFLVSYSSAKAESMQIDLPKGGMRRPERAFYLTLGAALTPISITVLGGDYPIVIALVFVAVASNITAAERFTQLFRLVKERDERSRREETAHDDHSESGDHGPALNKINR